MFDRLKISIAPYIPLLYVFLSGVGFSIQTLLVKLLEETGFKGSFEVIFSRGALQLILASVMIMTEGRKEAVPVPLCGTSRYVAAILTIRSVMGFVGIGLAFLAVERLPVGDATVLVMLAPLFSAILGFLILGEPWRLPEFIATLLSLAGAVLIARPPFIFDHFQGSTSGPAPDGIGILFALISSVASGCAYIAVRLLGTKAKMPWYNVCWAQALGQMSMSVPSLYLAGQQFRFDLSFTQWLIILVGGCVGAISQSFMTVGMQREKSATATAMRMSDVVFGFIWQALFTHDDVTGLSIMGAVLVSSSILLIVFAKDSKKDEAAVLTNDQEAVKEEGGRVTKWFSDLKRRATGKKYSQVVEEDVDGDIELEVNDSADEDPTQKLI